MQQSITKKNRKQAAAKIKKALLDSLYNVIRNSQVQWEKQVVLMNLKISFHINKFTQVNRVK